MAMGRPSTYTPEIAARICEQLAEGRSLRSICHEDGMPTEGAVRGWAIDDVDGFASLYARARNIGIDTWAEGTIDLADISRAGYIEKINEKGERSTEVRDMVERARLQIDARKWFASKMRPDKYGDLTRLAGADGRDLELKVTIRSVLDPPPEN